MSNITNIEQVGGNHYSKYHIQPWDIIADVKLDYFRGNILKYLVRFEDKNGLEDLQKALSYCKAIEGTLIGRKPRKAPIKQSLGINYDTFADQFPPLIKEAVCNVYSGNAKSIKESIERIIRTKYGTNNDELL